MKNNFKHSPFYQCYKVEWSIFFCMKSSLSILQKNPCPWQLYGFQEKRILQGYGETIYRQILLTLLTIEIMHVMNVLRRVRDQNDFINAPELRHIVDGLKNKMAVGYDCISSEVYEFVSDSLLTITVILGKNWYSCQLLFLMHWSYLCWKSKERNDRMLIIRDLFENAQLCPRYLSKSWWQAWKNSQFCALSNAKMAFDRVNH